MIIISYQWPCFVLYSYNFFRNSNIIFDNSGGIWPLGEVFRIICHCSPTPLFVCLNSEHLNLNQILYPWVWLNFHLVSRVRCSGEVKQTLQTLWEREEPWWVIGQSSISLSTRRLPIIQLLWFLLFFTVQPTPLHTPTQSPKPCF